MTNSDEFLDSSTQNSIQMPKLILFGNPLLDITVQINDDELLQKYGLEVNGQKEVSLEKLGKLIGDAKTRYKSMKFSIGGSSLNTARILVEMNQCDLTFFGAIGNDKNGNIVREILKRSNVNACLQQLSEIKTGTCLCLCQGESRSLTANIGAALKVEKEFIEEQLEAFTSNPMIYYIEGFFIPQKMHICRFLYDKFANSSETLLVTNLNAPYIVKSFTKDITWLTRKADIVFGNRDEFEELASMNKFETAEELFYDLLKDYEETNRQKIIVITDGSSPVLYYRVDASGIETDSVKVPKVKKEDIIDTTGAGDSFVAGFIHGLIEGKDIKECIELGCEISAKVIKVLGCNLTN